MIIIEIMNFFNTHIFYDLGLFRFCFKMKNRSLSISWKALTWQCVFFLFFFLLQKLKKTIFFTCSFQHLYITYTLYFSVNESLINLWLAFLSFISPQGLPHSHKIGRLDFTLRSRNALRVEILNFQNTVDGTCDKIRMEI